MQSHRLQAIKRAFLLPFALGVLLTSVGCLDVGDRLAPSLRDTGQTDGPSGDEQPAETDSTEDADQTETSEQPRIVIEMKNQAFTPKEATVSPGTKVVWKTLDESEFHIVKDELPDSNEKVDWKGPVQRAGDTWGRVFEEPGTHWYHCENHSNTMIGKIIVEESS